LADYHQNGVITTLHKLADRPLEDLEKDLIEFSSARPMTLVLPSLFSELEGPALKNIVDILKDIPYLNNIVIGLDQANKEEFEHAKEFFSVLPQNHRILWHDGPRLSAIHEELMEQELAPPEPGKGRNVWYCFGYILSALKETQVVGLHDCDILTYERDLPARLMYPIANPDFNYAFAKGYYARVSNEKMHGRVTRLLVTPLIHALRMVCGFDPYLNYMNSFRYPLAGEFAMEIGVLPDLRIPSDWGLEIGILSEIRRNYSNRLICQVDIADTYDHKHQEMSEDDKSRGLSKMSIDITSAMFRKLATTGIVLTGEKIRTIKAAYLRTALDMVEMYKHDAIMNGLEFNVHQEEEAIELFAANIIEASDMFFNDPVERPFIPRWNRVRQAVPGLMRRISEAVEEDNSELGV